MRQWLGKRRRAKMLADGGFWATSTAVPLAHPGFAGIPEARSLRVARGMLSRDERVFSHSSVAIPWADVQVLVERGIDPTSVPPELADRIYGELFLTARRMVYVSLGMGRGTAVGFSWGWSEFDGVSRHEPQRIPGAVVYPVVFTRPNEDDLEVFAGPMFSENLLAAGRHLIPGR